MKRLFAILFIAGMPAVLMAQDAEDGMALPEATVGDADPFGEELQLIPDLPEPDVRPEFGLPEPPEPARTLSRETREAVEAQERRVQLRRAHIVAERDDAVRAAWQQAEEADTDAERRYALTLYYNRLYDHMVRRNPALRPAIDERRERAISRFQQDRIRPSVWQPGQQ